jgi:uncharacterized membrane protein YphA (DoxX/SURF4 family)
MKITTWIASALLAIAFLAAGGGKLLTSASELHQSAHGVPVALLRIAGTAEVLGAFGLIVPAATRITPILTPIAAVGLTMTMIGATITNIAVGEPATAVATFLLGSLAAVIAWLRFGREAVEPRDTGHRPDRLTVGSI